MDLRDRRLWAVTGGLAAIGAAAALQRHHLRGIESDPENEVLRSPPSGRPLVARSADGTQLHAEQFGPDDGQTLVLAHGWTEAIPYWIYVIKDLASRGLRVVAYDLRGHGESDPGAGDDYAIDRFGEDLQAVLEVALPEGERAVLVGHSLGAMAIAAWAEHHDVERFASAAALLNTGVGDLAAEHLLVPVPFIANALNRVLPPSAFIGSRAAIPKFSTAVGHAVLRYAVFGPAATPAQIAFYERMLVACPPDVRADVGIALSELELHHALPRLTVPTVVMAGARDKLTPPSHAERIAKELPRLEALIVLDDTGHMSPLERPEKVCEVLADLAAVAAKGGDPVAA